MEQEWFKRAKWAHLPIHPLGYLVTLLAILFMMHITMAVIRHGHSVSEALYELFVNGTCTAFWWKWVAERTSIK
jgi:hypothetical protein